MTNNSCEKKTDCVASVICKDAAGVPVRKAQVELLALCKDKDGGTFTANLRASGLTDDNGKVTFTFKLPAIYDIKVSKGNLTGVGIIKLEEGKGVDKAVTVQ